MDSSERAKVEKQEELARKRTEAYMHSQLEEKLISWGVNWQKSTEKLEAFVRFAEDYLIETEHKLKFARSRVSFWIVDHLTWWRQASLLLALVINFMLIAFVDDKGPREMP